MPTSSSSAGSERPAIGVPTAMSLLALNRASRVASAACNTMNRLTPRPAATASAAARVSAGMVNRTRCASPVRRSGRGRSRGRSSWSGSPASAVRQ
ncbi:Uncharacterised protein [Mycobacteroides abscessus subsp. abscessus]|nr:Uncharacterised protein [Mycobacteroides abscessus subsp. abscessus]